MKIAEAASKTMCKTISAMEKLMPSKEPTLLESKGVVLKNEVHHFQVALWCDFGPWPIYGLHVKAGGDLAPYVSFSGAELVPSLVSFYQADDYYLTTEPVK